MCTVYGALDVWGNQSGPVSQTFTVSDGIPLSDGSGANTDIAVSDHKSRSDVHVQIIL